MEHVGGEPPADHSESSAQQGSDGQDASSAGRGSMVNGGSADWPELGGLGMHIDVSDAGSVSQDSADESELVESDADEQYGFERIAKLPNRFEEALMPILNGLAQRKQDALLKVVTDPEFGPRLVRWRSAAAYKKYMDGQNKQARPLLVPGLYDLLRTSAPYSCAIFTPSEVHTCVAHCFGCAGLEEAGCCHERVWKRLLAAL